MRLRLIFQYWYYRKYYHRGVKISTISASLEANERTPLIGDGNVIEDDVSTKDDDEEDPPFAPKSSCTPSRLPRRRNRRSRLVGRRTRLWLR